MVVSLDIGKGGYLNIQFNNFWTLVELETSDERRGVGRVWRQGGFRILSTLVSIEKFNHKKIDVIMRFT